ncbi:hypothetical protein [Sphingomonas faeni]|uniref:hypothetical protein n=1 Tax=Sphingomonas faeni TaxID=185950 RepID=UPI0033560755
MTKLTDQMIEAGIAAYHDVGTNYSIAPEVAAAVYAAVAAVDVASVTHSMELSGIEAYKLDHRREIGPPLVTAIYDAMEYRRIADLDIG